MSQPGMGAMLHYLGGGSKNEPSQYYGKTIVEASLDKMPAKQWRGGEDCLRLKFHDGLVISIWDNGQSCCESRYITTDDDVQSLVGGQLLRIEACDGPDTKEEYDVHEQVFIEIGTTKGFITICTHNEHNGYYGGFGLTITEEGQAD